MSPTPYEFAHDYNELNRSEISTSPDENTIILQEPMKAQEEKVYWGRKVKNEEESVPWAGPRVMMGEAVSENDHNLQAGIKRQKGSLSPIVANN